MSAQLLHEFPETRSVWNVRKRVLLAELESVRTRWQQADSSVDDKKISSASRVAVRIEAELTLTAECARSNPKSYATWAHRVWTFEQLALELLELLSQSPDSFGTSSSDAVGPLRQRVQSLWLKELALTQHYLKLDARNCILFF